MISRCKIFEMSPQKLKEFFKKDDPGDASYLFTQLCELIDLIINKVILLIKTIFSSIMTIRCFASNTEYTKTYLNSFIWTLSDYLDYAMFI